MKDEWRVKLAFRSSSFVYSQSYTNLMGAICKIP